MIKHYFWIVLLAVGLQRSWGFTPIGPQLPALGAESWQTAVIGYNYAYADYSVPGGPEFLGDIGGPHNIAEEYRRNTPVLYYAYDQTFLTFFGTDGAASVDGAFSIMNALPKADQMDLSQFPMEAMHPNYTAQSLFLTDLKSVTLHLLVEQLGLADPERFVWTLHDRVVPPGCPLTTEYTVVSRNFDYQFANLASSNSLSQITYSAYINSIFYSYIIEEFCAGAPSAFTVPFSTDPEAIPYSSVAANNFDGNGLFFDNSLLPHNTSGGLQVGYFYTGLTRDDAAALKYLYTTNKVDLEYPEPTSLLFSITTNYQTALFPAGTAINTSGTNGAGYYYFDGNFGYGDYGALLATATTNSPAVLQAMYPGLMIASSSNYFVLATNWVYSQYFAYLGGAGQPYPPPLTLVTVSNPVPYLQERFVTTFANVFSDPFPPIRPTSSNQLQVTTITPPLGAPYGSPYVTNTVLTTKTVNQPSGDFFLRPLFQTNVCPMDILSVGLTNVLSVTNLLTSGFTNLVTATNTSSYSSTLSQIFRFTNYTFEIYPTTCGQVSNAVNLYQGIGGVKFVRHDYDSLLGQYFAPITNYYSMVVLTNSHWRTVQFTRVVARPDILIDAADMGLPNTVVGTVIRNINFLPSPVVLPVAVLGPRGPGTITTPTVFTYDKIGEASWNGYDLNTFTQGITNGFLFQLGEIPSLAWASFDASTNDPILYPNGTSIATLESILTVNFSPAAPPDGYAGRAYSQTFAVGAGLLQPPLNWSAANLPPGMAVANAPNGTDFILSGTPTTPGIYDFILYLALPGAPGRNTQWNFTITIH